MASQITTVAKKYPLVTFFVLSYAISWLIWLPQGAAAQGFLHRPASTYLHLVGGLGPMLAALVAVFHATVDIVFSSPIPGNFATRWAY